MHTGFFDGNKGSNRKWRLLVSLTLIFSLFFMVGCDDNVKTAVLDSMNSLAVGLVDAIFIGLADADTESAALPTLMDMTRSFC
jgi:hypothetical protein